MIDGHLLQLFLHILGFALWLGLDLAAWHARRSAAATDGPGREALLALAQRLDRTVAGVLVLMLPLGIQLGVNLALIALDDRALQALWLAAIGWLLLTRFAMTGSRPILVRIERAVQISVILALFCVAAVSMAGLWPVDAGWVTAKLVLFALAMLATLRHSASRWPLWMLLIASGLLGTFKPFY